MNSSIFLECIGATGINGVNNPVLGLYSFLSGDNLLVYNQIYNTGFHYFNGHPYNDALPLIFNGTGNQSSGLFQNSGFYQISNSLNEDFSAIIYLNYSGCRYTGNKNLFLVSTSNVSGATLGITPSNRLFIQTPDYSYTIPKEIGVNDFAYLSVVNNRFISFGLFSMEDNILYGKNYDEGNIFVNITDLYFGGTINYLPSFTGYSGYINEIYLFGGSLGFDLASNCINCAFATGSSSFPIPYYFNELVITGNYWTGVQVIQNTGTTQVLTTYPLLYGGNGFVYVDSGISGNVMVGQSLVALVQSISGTGYSSGLSFNFNGAAMMGNMVFDYFFNGGLYSGDIIEIYTYSGFNSNFNYFIDNFKYPLNPNVVQIYGNGLAETYAVDYSVNFNNLISGFDNLDILLYDLYPITYTMPYTTGYILTGTTGANFINITGISGLSMSIDNGNNIGDVEGGEIGGIGGGTIGDVDYSINFIFNYDIYLNGQKMVYGINYSYSGGVLTVSGNDLMDINDPNGDYLEIKFIPTYPQLIRNTYIITQNQSFISGISGFSEQVWINGLRQLEGLDYSPLARCRFCQQGFNNPDYPFELYSTVNSSLNEIMVWYDLLNSGMISISGNYIIGVGGDIIGGFGGDIIGGII